MTDTPTGGVTVTGATGTGSVTTDRRCGTCRYWEGPGPDGRGKCDWARHNLPFSMRYTATQRTWEDGGADCVMWELKP